MSNWVKSCPTCQKRIIYKVADRVPLRPIKPIGEPFQEFFVDTLGSKLPRTRSGKRYCLTMVCLASRWIAAATLSNLKALTIADGLMQTFAQTGLPKVVHLDSFSSHKSQLMAAFSKVLGIEVQFSAPCHKTGDGLAERAIGLIGGWLKKYLRKSPRDWDSALNYILLHQRESVNSTLGFSPAEIVY